jgi:hypothetical protein
MFFMKIRLELNLRLNYQVLRGGMYARGRLFSAESMHNTAKKSVASQLFLAWILIIGWRNAYYLK